MQIILAYHGHAPKYFILFFQESFLGITSWPQNHYISGDGLEFTILLPLPLKYWKYGCIAPHQNMTLGIT